STATATRPTVETFISQGVRNEAAPDGRGVDGASCGSPQKTAAQILIMEKRVNRPTARLRPLTTHAPASKPARSRRSLPKNPERGGIPARLIAATRKDAAAR